MHCPFCGHPETRVVDSRLAGEGVQVRRRRECERCTERFTTFETAQLAMPAIIKRDHRRQPFDEDKLRRGLRKALEKRPVSDEQLEAAIDRIGRACISRPGGGKRRSAEVFPKSDRGSPYDG